MKKIAIMTLLGTSVLFAGYSEHAYLYKDPRIMGMGGANVATGGYASSLFHNPAGLAGIKQSHGLEVELLGLSLSVSKKMGDFINDLNDAADTESSSAVAEVLQANSGEHFHFDISDYSSVSYSGETLAWSVGFVAGSDANFIAHGNGGSNDLIETHSRGYGGLTAGMAYNMGDIGPGRLHLGLGAKFIKQNSYEGGLGVAEIIDNKDDIVKYLQDTYEKSASGFALDAGALYTFDSDGFWRPSVGISLLNIGGLDLDDRYGSQPMTLNVGVSVSPDVPVLEHLVLAADYVDLLGANKSYFYDFDVADGAVTKVNRDEADDTDMLKRLRFGANLGLIDNPVAMLSFMGGLYQGNVTAGVDLQFTLVKLQAATYAEEIGPESGQLTDRRYVLGIGMGW